MLEKMPDDKLYYVAQIIQDGSDVLYGKENPLVRKIRYMNNWRGSRISDLDCDKKLENYREKI